MFKKPIRRTTVLNDVGRANKMRTENYPFTCKKAVTGDPDKSNGREERLTGEVSRENGRKVM